MPQQLLYRLATGEIVGEHSASTPALLAAQGLPPGTGAVGTETPVGIDQREAWVVQDGSLTAKTVGLLTATDTPFPADGITVCRVTLDPFVACTLEVNGVLYALTEEDPALEITSDVATTFAVSLKWHQTHWAAPLLVVAEEP
jgi:hypothetical protein